MVNIIKVGCRLIISAFRTEQSPNPSCVASLKTATKSHNVSPVWIEIIAFAFWSSAFWFFFFFCFRFHAFQGVMRLLFMNSSRICWLFHGEQCTRALFMDPQIPLFSNFFIKNESHDIIHTFKNYFTIAFSVFNF